MTDRHPGPAPWISMIEQLPLARTEQEVVKRFLQDTGGRGFLPVADVLRSHKLMDEALELLTQGVQSHPNFAVARVVLARELFQRGMFLESWRLLDESPVPLYDNVLAQKLIFKMAVGFGDEHGSASALKILRQLQGLDSETKRLGEMLEASGIVITRDVWRKELAAKGIHLEPTQIPVDTDRIPQGVAGQSHKKRGLRGARFILEYELDEATKKDFLNYHVIPLNEIFTGERTSPENGKTQEGGRSAVELDSTTLAEIYTKQGHYSKALGIYRRLLRLAPHNDLLRMKVSELSRLDGDQRREDLEADPVMYDRME
ncbi:MAG: tetratricopeptide repeat protein, partial [Proteobacteria bacterium]|nr:tetratricopeptide repeat protein [Pseudomonadota bacterium]